jgi:hypothetical protein
MSAGPRGRKGSFVIRRAIPLALVFLLGNCGDDAATPDAAPMVDAAPDAEEIDAAPPSDIGDSCMRPQDSTCRSTNATVIQGTCQGGEICQLTSCRGGLSWPDGYCTKQCSATNPTCPTGSTCIDIGNQSAIYRCLKNCTTHQDCRMPGTGYVCQPTRTANVCMGGAICETAPANLSALRGDWSANRQVPGATISDFESEGNISADGLGHLAVSAIGLYMSTAGNGEGSIMSVAIFDESGQSFHTPVAYGEYPATEYTSDPVVVYDTESTATPRPIYLTWINIDASMTLHTLVAKSIDGGNTFGPPNNIASAAVNTSGQDVSGADNVFDKPWIAASGDKVYITYSIGTAEQMVVSEDGGVTWSAGRAVNSGTGFQNFGQIAIANQTGDVFVSWINSNNIVAARWLRSTGASWFESEVNVPGSANVANPPGNAVARDGSHLWVVWDDATTTGSNIKSSVAAGASAAGALSFAAPVTVNDDTSCGDHIHGTVAVDGSGIGHVVWLDNRYSGGTVQGVAHYAKSTDSSGSAFGTPVVASDTLFPFTTSRVPGLWLGDYIGITAASNSNKVWATWADGRNGTPQRTHFFIASRPLP